MPTVRSPIKQCNWFRFLGVLEAKHQWPPTTFSMLGCSGNSEALIYTDQTLTAVGVELGRAGLHFDRINSNGQSGNVLTAGA